MSTRSLGEIDLMAIPSVEGKTLIKANASEAGLATTRFVLVGLV